MLFLMQFPRSQAAKAGGAIRAVWNTSGRIQPSVLKPYLEMSQRGFKGPTLEAAGALVSCGQQRIAITRRVGTLIAPGARGKSTEITADN